MLSLTPVGVVNPCASVIQKIMHVCAVAGYLPLPNESVFEIVRCRFNVSNKFPKAA
jgi:hypothetical protein